MRDASRRRWEHLAARVAELTESEPCTQVSAQFAEQSSGAPLEAEQPGAPALEPRRAQTQKSTEKLPRGLAPSAASQDALSSEQQASMGRAPEARQQFVQQQVGPLPPEEPLASRQVAQLWLDGSLQPAARLRAFLPELGPLWARRVAELPQEQRFPSSG